MDCWNASFDVLGYSCHIFSGSPEKSESPRVAALPISLLGVQHAAGHGLDLGEILPVLVCHHHVRRGRADIQLLPPGKKWNR